MFLKLLNLFFTKTKYGITNTTMDIAEQGYKYLLMQ